MGTLVLDTSVVIGLVRTLDAHHTAAASALRSAAERGDKLVLPASVLAESLVGAYRTSTAAGERLSADLVEAFGPERVVDAQVASATAALRAQHRSLRLPDALVIATGMVEQATVLTCDKRLASVDRRVRVISAA